MINSVIITNHLGEIFTLELTSPEKSGLLVEKITGLGPAKASVNVSNSSTSDISTVNSVIGNTRNIVFTIRMTEYPSIEETRLKSYRCFPIKKNISMIFVTDSRRCIISGYVDNNEPDIFSQEEKSQISVICADPFFYTEGEEKHILYGLESVFEFPFENDSLTENLIEVGEFVSDRYKTILYQGEAEIGITMHMHFTGSASNIEIFKTETREQVTIDTDKIATTLGEGLKSGDDIYISTLDDRCGAKIIRDGVTINIMNCVVRNTDWIKLKHGENTFTYTADEGISNFSFDIINKTSYEGI